MVLGKMVQLSAQDTNEPNQKELRNPDKDPERVLARPREPVRQETA